MSANDLLKTVVCRFHGCDDDGTLDTRLGPMCGRHWAGITYADARLSDRELSQIGRAVELHARGRTFAEIGGELGVGTITAQALVEDPLARKGRVDGWRQPDPPPAAEWLRIDEGSPHAEPYDTPTDPEPEITPPTPETENEPMPHTPDDMPQCKREGCTDLATDRRGPYALLCAVHREEARAVEAMRRQGTTVVVAKPEAPDAADEGALEPLTEIDDLDALVTEIGRLRQIVADTEADLNLTRGELIERLEQAHAMIGDELEAIAAGALEGP